MDYVTDAIQKTFAFYFSEVACLIIFIIVGIVYVCKDKPHNDRIGLITICLTVVLIFLLFHSVIPFVSDVIQNQIITDSGTYVNVLGTDSKSGSSISGLYSVELQTESGSVHLTTAPWCQERFPKGTFEVNAHYTKQSGILLHIEVLEK